MSASMRPGRNRSRSPDDYSKRSLLSKVDKKVLQKLRVAISRSGITQSGPNLPLERDIDDFKQISSLVHVRRGLPPRIPIFSGDIKVNQDLYEDRTVFRHDRHSLGRSRSRSQSDKYRSRSRERSYNESRRSRSRDRYRRSRERNRERSRSRSRRKTISRSKSRERRRYRDVSREKSRRSGSRTKRSRSRSKRPVSVKHKSYCPLYKSSDERKRRSVTPLRPGEYRPGHPDLALRKHRKTSRSRTRSRSPRGSSRSEKHSRNRSPKIAMPGLDYGFYEGFAQFGPVPMQPYRPIPPGFYPRMYPTNMMMPRMPMNIMPGYHPRMPMFRQRLPVYNSNKAITKPSATITSKDDAGNTVVEESNDKQEENLPEITSSNRQNEAVTETFHSNKA